MTLRDIAKAANVSVSTVSRVINGAPGIAAATRVAVRKAMEGMSYVPTRRRTVRAQATRGQHVAFFVIHPNTGVTPAYDHLLRGVSSGCSKFGLDLKMGFIDTPEQAIEQIVRGRFDGLLLHGICPPQEQTVPLHGIPTVWLMGNNRRAVWGDQVIPDNTQIGRMAADYLLGRGHRHVLYFGLSGSWFLGVRSMGFGRVIDDVGGVATLCIHAPKGRHSQEEVAAGVQELVQVYRSLPKRPTGLFVAEDWLLRQVYQGLLAAGIQPGVDLDIISCNNDRPHLLGLNPMPATIDIRFERIAYRGVERLASRLRGDDLEDRLRMMVEPTLVPPPLDARSAVARSASQAGT